MDTSKGMGKHHIGGTSRLGASWSIEPQLPPSPSLAPPPPPRSTPIAVQPHPRATDATSRKLHEGRGDPIRGGNVGTGWCGTRVAAAAAAAPSASGVRAVR
ncbi:hypothetical protein VaNZ11_002018, partial [Volvox africanus]